MNKLERVRTSPVALQQIEQALGSLLFPPPVGAEELENIIATKYGVTPSEVLVGCGSTELLYALCHVEKYRRTRIVTSTPTFTLYQKLAEVFDYDLSTVDLKEFAHDVIGIQEQLFDDSSILFIDSPHYITGLSLSVDIIKQITKMGNSLVVVDNVYGEYADNRIDNEIAGLIRENPNLLICRTFSKVHGLLGLRVGYVFGEASLILSIRKRLMPYSVNSLAQVAAMASMEDVKNIQRNIRLNKNAKLFAYQSLSALGIQFVPTESNALLIHLGSRAEDIVKQCKESSIQVRDQIKCGLNGYVQVHLIDVPTVSRFIALLQAVW